MNICCRADHIIGGLGYVWRLSISAWEHIQARALHPAPAHQELRLSPSLALSSVTTWECTESILIPPLCSFHQGPSLPSAPTDNIYLLCDLDTLRNQLLSPTSRDKKMEGLRQPRRWKDWLCCMSVKPQPILFNARQKASVMLLL